jgi:long-chain fatty acid transport protein
MRTHLKQIYLPFSFIAILSLVAPHPAFAVGSSVIENASFSGRQIAQAGAGVAQADEPAAISFNPAGITQLDGLQIQPTTHFLTLSTFFRSSDALSGGEGSKTQTSLGPVLVVPTGYITFKPKGWFGDRVALGVGTDSPFGFSNKWDSTHPIAQLSGAKNWFKMYTVKPTIAFQLTDWLSFGGGPMYYRVYDWGSVQGYPNLLGATLGGGAGPSGQTIGQVRLNLSGNRWGWQMGFLAKPHQKHQFGFYFRSPVVVPTSGPTKVENAFSGNFETAAYAKYSLPLNMTWGYAFKPTDRATIELDFGYTRWSTFERLFIDHDSVNAIEDAVINGIGFAGKDFRDSFSWQLGGNYKLNDKLTLMMGSYFYTHGAPNSSFISALPDGNRLAYSVGASCQAQKNLAVDVAYLNVWNLKRRINNEVGNVLGVGQDGDYTTFTQELTISFRFMWEDLFSNITQNKSDLDLRDRQNVVENTIRSFFKRPAVQELPQKTTQATMRASVQKAPALELTQKPVTVSAQGANVKKHTSNVFEQGPYKKVNQ